MFAPKTRLPGVTYHPEDDVARYLQQGTWSRRTLGDWMEQIADEHADRTAIIGPDVSWTYREMGDATDRMAAALLDTGLQPLDRVIIQMGNVPETLLVFYACLKAGIIPVCTIAAYRAHEIGSLARTSGARAHIVQGDAGPRLGLVELAGELRSAVASFEQLIVVRGTAPAGAHDLLAMAAKHSSAGARRRLAELERDPFQVGVYQLSGGSTGIPKIIPRFHAEYIYQAEQWAKVSPYDRDTVTFWPLPALHNAALACFHMPTHAVGGATILTPWTGPEEIFSLYERHRPTVAGIMLPHIMRMKESGQLGSFDLSAMKQAISPGETKLIEAMLKVPGYHLFGMSEGLLMRTTAAHPARVRETSIGEPISPHDEVRLLAFDGEQEVPLGMPGEYCLRGPYTMRGYLDEPEANARAFTSDGFLRSGDIMTAEEIDGRRYYTFVGRLKDNINRMGEKIGAREVEEFVARHPAIAGVAVVAMPDPRYGERVCAFVVPQPGAEVPPVADLGTFLAALGLAKFKWPERIEAVEAFPTTRVGKLDKRALREMITSKLAAERQLAGLSEQGV